MASTDRMAGTGDVVLTLEGNGRGKRSSHSTFCTALTFVASYWVTRPRDYTLALHCFSPRGKPKVSGTCRVRPPLSHLSCSAYLPSMPRPQALGNPDLAGHVLAVTISGRGTGGQGKGSCGQPAVQRMGRARGLVTRKDCRTEIGGDFKKLCYKRS